MNKVDLYARLDGELLGHRLKPVIHDPTANNERDDSQNAKRILDPPRHESDLPSVSPQERSDNVLGRISVGTQGALGQPNDHPLSNFFHSLYVVYYLKLRI